jgi:beta-glucosidase
MKELFFKNLCAFTIIMSHLTLCSSQNLSGSYRKKTIAQKVDSVLQLMTLEEKVGQMNQYNGDWEATGPITRDGDKQNQIRKGMLGSILNVTGVDHTRQLQEMAMQSRLKYPCFLARILFMATGQHSRFRLQKPPAGIWMQ